MIAEVERIKNVITSVRSKCERSTTLLASLAEERDRWEQGSDGFHLQMSTIVGDALLAAGFLTYAGFFDHRYR